MRYYSKYTLFYIIFAVIFAGCSNERAEKPKIEDGVLNLQNWNFENKNIADIKGNVDFYWNKFLISSEIKKLKEPGCVVNFSHSWNKQVDSTCVFPVKGFATYHFKIHISEKDVGKNFIIRPKHFIAYASQMYVNGQLVTYSGNVGVSELDSEYSPSRNATANSFVADSSVLDVVIWVSNFTHFRGGIFNTIHFGLSEDMITKRENGIAYDLLIIVSLLVMFLYHFILYFGYRKEASSLFFSFTSLVFALDLSFQGSMTFFIFFPDVNFATANLLHLISPYLIPPSFITFLYALFPKEVSKIIRNITIVVAVFLIALTAFTNNNIYNNVITPHLFYMLAVVAYVYYPAIKAVISKREGAKLFLIAYLLFSVCAINDVLHVSEIIHTTNVVSAGLIIFVFLLSVLQGKRFTQIYNRNLLLTSNLKELNIDLEKKVEERTATIAEQNKELNSSFQKFQKLNQFKDDLTHMIVHDLKTPLSTIINIDIISDAKNIVDIVKHSGFKMLNLVKNILDVYKYESAEFELNKENYYISDIVKTALEEMKFLIEEKSLNVKIKITKDSIVLADNEVVKRVLVNLLSNAVKFSPNKGEIIINTLCIKNEKVKVSIYNQGEGIPKDKQQLIFEKFGQASQNKLGDQSSTGLGLTFCKMAIDAHNGEIGVISESKTGVEFWFTLPNLQGDNKTDNCLKKISHVSDLTKEDKEYLLNFAEQLKTKQVYEASAINSILKSIKKDKNTIILWVDKLEKAVYSGNSEGYKSLLTF